MRRIAFLAAMVVMTISTQTHAADPVPEWLGLLRAKMAAELKCDVTRITDITFNSADSRKFASSVRIHCLDGRMFEARRDRLHQPFSVRECGPAVC